jgi:hypothetical protein
MIDQGTAHHLSKRQITGASQTVEGYRNWSEIAERALQLRTSALLPSTRKAASLQAAISSRAVTNRPDHGDSTTFGSVRTVASGSDRG